MRTKRSAEADSPASTPVKGSPKKAKTPPKKNKKEQSLTHGQPCVIQFFRCGEIKLWHARNLEDKSDAFMKNIIDKMRSDESSELREKFDFRGDVTRRLSLGSDEVMKNHRKSYERKFLVQINDEELPERDIATGNALLKVRFRCVSIMSSKSHLLFA